MKKLVFTNKFNLRLLIHLECFVLYSSVGTFDIMLYEYIYEESCSTKRYIKNDINCFKKTSVLSTLICLRTQLRTIIMSADMMQYACALSVAM